MLGARRTLMSLFIGTQGFAMGQTIYIIIALSHLNLTNYLMHILYGLVLIDNHNSSYLRGSQIPPYCSVHFPYPIRLQLVA